MLQKARKFLKLQSFEKRLFLKAILLLISSSVYLRVFGLKHTQQFLDKILPSRSQYTSPPNSAETSQSIVDLVKKAASICGAACLARSLVTRCLLLSQGYSANLRIGVRKDGASLQGHAWLEAEGSIITDSHESCRQYHAFSRDMGTIE